nr:hypothetical protein [uncultured Draconibacterium sp.]
MVNLFMVIKMKLLKSQKIFCCAATILCSLRASFIGFILQGVIENNPRYYSGSFGKSIITRQTSPSSANYVQEA